jgi:Arc/MetJ-type ribon-helix-helix transcriptional regulator
MNAKDDFELVPFGSYIPLEQKERLRQVAFERRTSASEIVRSALTEWFARHVDQESQGKAG